MINKLAQNAADILIKNEIISVDSKDVYVYVLDLIISGLISTLAVVLAGSIIGEFFYAMIFNIIMVVVRIYTGGYHASTHVKCTISYIIIFIISIILLRSEFMSINQIVDITASLLALLIIIIYAPLENKNKILSESQRIKYKIISITEYVILLGISEISELMNKYWSEILCRKLSDLGIYIRILLTIISVLLIIGKIKNCTMKSKKL